jgi:DNA polymerase-3 subunit alpha
VPKTNFVHLHLHSDGSALDGKGTVKDYITRAVQLGMPAIAITDHGNVSAWWEWYTECIAQGIEPVLGEEFYFAPDAAASKEAKEGERFHVGIIAKGERGAAVLAELSSAAHRQFYHKPLLDRPLIESLSPKDRASLVVLSGCAGSIISQKLMVGSDKMRLSKFFDEVKEAEMSAHDEIRWWKKKFPHFHIELMHHGTDFDRTLNRKLLKAAEKHELPWVITNDPHFVLKEEAHHHDALLAIQTNAGIEDEKRFRFDGKGYWLKSRKEMEKAFTAYGEEVWKPGCAQTLKVAEACRVRIKDWDSRTWHIPDFPGVDDPDAELKKMAFDGLKKLGLNKKEYRKRLLHELREFRRVGMANFLLATADFCREAREKGIRIGPGRGSVCGTLVGYCIGIHKIDPIKYDLLFERFLNPERPKMPDVDTDFQRSRRSEMFDYAEQKYGKENTQRVGAYQRLQLKGAWKKLANAYGIPFAEANKISKAIIEDEDGDAVLPAAIEEAYPELHATLMSLKGIKAGLARHPAGVIIFDPNDPIKRLVPIAYIASSKEFVSQFDLDTAAGLGLLKQDFLGLRTLDTIEECVRLVKERHGVDIEPDDWVPGEEKDDDKVWKMLRDGKTAGVFQMEGGANHRGIQEIKCGEFEDIVSCTSLYRAGPMIAGAPKRFLANKKDKKVRVSHESLRDALQRSWGEMIYQEQMFAILNELAGFSWSRVDDAKTAMAKKDPEKMAALKDEAVAGFQKVAGMSEGKARDTWKMIESQAAYLFNRSHAVAYSMVTYQTARLKYLYPLEFLAALLRTVEPKNEQDKGKREEYMNEAIRSGFKLSPPDVNVSDDKFMPYGKDELLFGLVDIKGVGPAAIEKLVAARKAKRKKLRKAGVKKPELIFERVDEVAKPINNSGVVKALAAAGALRSLGVEPEIDKQEELLRWQFVDPVVSFRKKYAKELKAPTTHNGKVVIVGQLTKAEKRKTKKGDTFMTWTVRQAPGEDYRVQLWSDCSDLFKIPTGTIVMVKGRWNATYSNLGIDESERVTILRRVAKKETKAA